VDLAISGKEGSGRRGDGGWGSSVGGGDRNWRGGRETEEERVAIAIAVAASLAALVGGVSEGMASGADEVGLGHRWADGDRCR
jgi:hypothetical protein